MSPAMAGEGRPGPQPWDLVQLQTNRSKPGLLVIAEIGKVTRGLFDSSRRVYWIANDTPDPVSRGGHFHPVGGKKDFLIALSGTVECEIHSERGCASVTLDRPDLALVIPPGVWHGVTLSPGAILVSVASTVYAPDESRPERTCSCR